MAVVFRIRDAYLPSADDVLRELSEDDEIVGWLEGYSDSGVESRQFAIVRLAAGSKVVISAENVRALAQKAPAAE